MDIQRVKFSGHQTFSLRYGWLEKGYAFVAENKSFTHDTAIVDLGVGKNMVDSIKYWCELAYIIKDDAVTTFGTKLLDESNGWDPFLEDLASWWLLHWKMMTNPYYKTSGTALFSSLHTSIFSKKDVAEAALRFVAPDKKAPADTSVMRDVDCFLRSYCGLKRFETKKLTEEPFDCPFEELNLIQPMNEGAFYRFFIGPKPSLPAEILGYAIADYFISTNRNAMNLQGVLYNESSPGRIFMLNENALVEAVQELQKNPIWSKYISFIESAGIAQILCSMEQNTLDSLLDGYYGKGTS